MFQMPHLNFARRIPHPGNRRAGKIDRVPVEVQHRLHHVRVHDVAGRLNRRRHRADRSLGFLQQGIDRRINRIRIQQRLVSLYVHEDVALFVSRHFGHAFRSGTVLGPRHSRFTAKSLHRFHDAFVVGRHNHPVRPLRHLGPFIHPLNHRLSRQQDQRLPRQPDRTVPRRNHHHHLGRAHGIRFSIFRTFVPFLQSNSLQEMRELCAMLPHATPSGRPMKMSKIEHQAIALVLEKPSGRIYCSTNRAATPAGRDGEGAVKRDLPGFRVLSFSFHVLLIVCLFLLHAALPAAAQTTSNENKSKDEGKREEAKEVKKDDVRKDTAGTPFKPGGTIHFDVDLALINVTVTDPYNRLVTGLETDNFRVFEDSIEQEVVTFSAEDVPISIGVIFDFSGSMANKVAKAREAAVQFFKTANPQDEFFLVSFNERAELTSSFTNSVEDLQSRMMLTVPKGRTALLDAIYLGLSQMRGAHNAKRALLILSDGGDNHSRYNESDIKRLVKEADTQLYAVGIFDPLGYRNRTPEELGGPSLLSEVTEMTGGRVFAVEKLDDLPDIASKIGMELRNQYVLGYRPSNKAHDARWRKLKIKLRAPKGLPPLSVYSKTGYYAPSH